MLSGTIRPVVIAFLLCAAFTYAQNANEDAAAGLLSAIAAEAPLRASADVRDIYIYTNHQRALESLQPLAWNDNLMEAARVHAQLMAGAGSLSHRYPGEPDVGARVAATGAHFTSIAENIGAGVYARQIEEAWMHSVPHRTNILDSRMNAIGIAIVPSAGTLYAVEDFAVVTPQLTPEAVEQTVLSELQSAAPPGLLVLDSSHTAEARRLCDNNEATATWPATFSVTWQSADLALPQPLADAVHTGKFHNAVVGGCQASEGAFSVYRIHVSLE